ncbi:MAG: hypothetical protein RLZZ504_397, partial [Bacteroidota bacterium]
MKPFHLRICLPWLLSLILFIQPLKSSAQQNASQEHAIHNKTVFPAFHQERLFGHYKGQLTVYKNATEVGMTATMEIIFGKPITTPTAEKNLSPPLRYPFIIKYDGDIRRYQLVVDAQNPNNLYIDEMNGIHI